MARRFTRPVEAARCDRPHRSGDDDEVSPHEAEARTAVARAPLADDETRRRRDAGGHARVAHEGPAEGWAHYRAVESESRKAEQNAPVRRQSEEAEIAMIRPNSLAETEQRRTPQELVGAIRVGVQIPPSAPETKRPDYSGLFSPTSRTAKKGLLCQVWHLGSPARSRAAEQLLAKTRGADAQHVQPDDRERPGTSRRGDRILLGCEGPNGPIRQTPTRARATLPRGG